MPTYNQIYNSVFSADFIAIRGVPDLPGMRLKRIEAYGVDGYAFKENAYRAEPSLLTTFSAVDTVAQAAALEGNLKNMQGTEGVLYD